MYLEFTVSQTCEFFLACHENAFAAFGGVVSRIMVDNLKSAVLQRLVGEAPVFNPKYLDFSRHWGFEIAPCNIRAGNEKGRVENGVGYVKKSARWSGVARLLRAAATGQTVGRHGGRRAHA